MDIYLIYQLLIYNKSNIHVTHPHLSHKVYVHLVNDELILCGIDVQVTPYDSGIIDHNIHQAQFLFYLAVHDFNLFPVGNVAFDTDSHTSLVFYNLHRFLVSLFINIHTRYFRAQFVKSQRQFTAYSTSCAGDL